MITQPWALEPGCAAVREGSAALWLSPRSVGAYTVRAGEVYTTGRDELDLGYMGVSQNQGPYT